MPLGTQLGLILGRFGGPTWRQVGAKLREKPFQKMQPKNIKFGIVFFTIFLGFWPPTWGARGGKKSRFSLLFGCRTPSWGPDGSKMAPRSDFWTILAFANRILHDFSCFFVDFGSLQAIYFSWFLWFVYRFGGNLLVRSSSIFHRFFNIFQWIFGTRLLNGSRPPGHIFAWSWRFVYRFDTMFYTISILSCRLLINYLGTVAGLARRAVGYIYVYTQNNLEKHTTM